MRKGTGWSRLSAGALVSVSTFVMAVSLSGRAARAQSGVAPRRPLLAHVPDAVRSLRATRVGSVADSERLEVSIQLPLRNEAELDAFLQRLYDPASPSYR